MSSFDVSAMSDDPERHFGRLKDDQRGSAMVEMAMVAPIFVFRGPDDRGLQFGIAMRDYNSLRSATADMARFAVVNFEVSKRLTDEQLESYARTVATKAPYTLGNARLTVDVTTSSTLRIAGAIEPWRHRPDRRTWRKREPSKRQTQPDSRKKAGKIPTQASITADWLKQVSWRPSRMS